MVSPPRRVAALVAGVVAAILLVVPVGAAPTGGSTDDPRRGPSSGMDVVGTSTFVGPEGIWSLDLQVPPGPPGSTVRVQLHDRVADRAGFLASVTGQDLPGVVRSWPALAVDQLPADGILPVRLPVTSGPTADGLAMRITEPGAYPLLIRLEGPGGDDLDEVVVHLVRLPDVAEADLQPIQLALLVPVAAPLALQPDGTRTVSVEDGDRLADTVDVLAAHPEIPLTVVPRPETLDALAQDEAGAATVTELGAALADRTVATRPWVEIDLGDWLASDLPVAAATQIDAGARSTARRLGRQPEAATWLVGPEVSGEALAWLAARGIDGVVVGQDLLDPPAEGPAVDARRFLLEGGGATIPAVPADPVLAAHLLDPDVELAANRLLADATVLWELDPEVARGTAVAVPGDAAAALEALLETWEEATAAEGAPVVVPATVEDLLAEVEPAGGDEELVRPLRTEPGAPRSDYAAALERSAQGLASITGMVGFDSAHLETPSQLILASGADQLTPQEADTYLDATDTAVTALADTISMPDQEAVTLTSREGTVPLTIDNALDQPVVVRLGLVADKLDLPSGSTVETTLAPGPNRVEVVVRARATGAFPLEVAVTTPDEAVVLDEARTTVRSTAVPGLGLALSMGAGLFLAGWWARNWRRARRSRALVRPEGSAPDPGYDRSIDSEGGSA